MARNICEASAEGYAKQTLPQIAQYVEEPEKIQDFAKACKKLGVNLRV